MRDKIPLLAVDETLKAAAGSVGSRTDGGHIAAYHGVHVAITSRKLFFGPAAETLEVCG